MTAQLARAERVAAMRASPEHLRPISSAEHLPTRKLRGVSPQLRKRTRLRFLKQRALSSLHTGSKCTHRRNAHNSRSQLGRVTAVRDTAPKKWHPVTTAATGSRVQIENTNLKHWGLPSAGPLFSRMRDLEDQARQILNHRIQCGTMTTKLAAHLTRLQEPQVSNFRHGHRGLSVESLLRMIDALGFTIELLPKKTAIIAPGRVAGGAMGTSPSKNTIAPAARPTTLADAHASQSWQQRSGRT